MSYRDEGEALRAKVGELQDQLAAAEDRIARLEGKGSAPAGEGEKPKVNLLLGAPGSLSLSRELPYEIDDEGYEAIAAVVRSRFGVQVAQVGRSLHAGEFLSIKVEDGKTIVRLHAKWDILAAGPIATGGLAGFFGAAMAGGLLHDFGHLSGPMILLHLAWVVPLVAGSAGWLIRGRARRAALKNAERFRGLFETVLQLAEKHARKKKPRVRVADEEEEVEVADQGAVRSRST